MHFEPSTFSLAYNNFAHNLLSAGWRSCYLRPSCTQRMQDIQQHCVSGPKLDPPSACASCLCTHRFDHHPRSAGSWFLYQGGCYADQLQYTTQQRLHGVLAVLNLTCFPGAPHDVPVHALCSHLQRGGGFFVAEDGVARLVGCNTFENEANNACDRHANLSRPLFDRANSCS